VPAPDLIFTGGKVFTGGRAFTADSTHPWAQARPGFAMRNGAVWKRTPP